MTEKALDRYTEVEIKNIYGEKLEFVNRTVTHNPEFKRIEVANNYVDPRGKEYKDIIQMIPVTETDNVEELIKYHSNPLFV